MSEMIDTPDERQWRQDVLDALDARRIDEFDGSWDELSAANFAAVAEDSQRGASGCLLVILIDEHGTAQPPLEIYYRPGPFSDLVKAHRGKLTMRAVPYTMREIETALRSSHERKRADVKLFEPGRPGGASPA